MSNKYKAQARAARKDWKVWKSCLSKRKFATEVEAVQQGQTHYKCRYCDGWHRSGALETAVNSNRNHPR